MAQDNLIVGTDPGGLVLRISPAGEGFVLYQMAKREVTAVAVAKDGSIYAAGVGTKQAVHAQPRPRPPRIPPPAPGGCPSGQSPSLRTCRRPRRHRWDRTGSATISGGSELYRIDRRRQSAKGSGATAQDIVYSIGFDGDGRPLIGTGNKGYIYRIDSDTLYTALLNAAPTQVTALLPGPAESSTPPPATSARSTRSDLASSAKDRSKAMSSTPGFSRSGAGSTFTGAAKAGASPSKRAAAIWTSRRRTGARGRAPSPAERARA